MTNLAQACASAESNLLRTERDLERLLDSLFPNWSAYELDAMRAIDVYGVDEESPDAADVLLRSGFGAVFRHPHPIAEFTTCQCRRVED